MRLIFQRIGIIHPAVIDGKETPATTVDVRYLVCDEKGTAYSAKAGKYKRGEYKPSDEEKASLEHLATLLPPTLKAVSVPDAKDTTRCKFHALLTVPYEIEVPT